MTTPLWLTGSLRPFFVQFFCTTILFLYSSSVHSSSLYSCHLFLIFSAFVRSLPFLSFIEPIFAWNIPLKSSIFLKRSLSLSHSIISLYFFALFIEEGLLISPCYSLELCTQLGISFPYLPWLSFPFFPQSFIRPPQTITLPCCISFFFGMVLITDSCTISLEIYFYI